MSTITFSSTGSVNSEMLAHTNNSFIEGARGEIFRLFTIVDVVAGETVTIDNHGEDFLGLRRVDVWNRTTKQPATGVTVTKTDVRKTTLTFSNAGTYSILIEY